MRCHIVCDLITSTYRKTPLTKCHENLKESKKRFKCVLLPLFCLLRQQGTQGNAWHISEFEKCMEQWSTQGYYQISNFDCCKNDSCIDWTLHLNTSTLILFGIKWMDIFSIKSFWWYAQLLTASRTELINAINPLPLSNFCPQAKVRITRYPFFIFTFRLLLW